MKKLSIEMMGTGVAHAPRVAGFGFSPKRSFGRSVRVDGFARSKKSSRLGAQSPDTQNACVTQAKPQFPAPWIAGKNSLQPRKRFLYCASPHQWREQGFTA